MNGIIQMAILGFLIGLTGAMAPGPTLIATINASLKGGWTMGPRVTLGHAVVEIVMVLLIIAGLSVIIGGYSWLIAGIGGAALVVFGVLTIMESRHVQFDFMPEASKGSKTAASPFLAGMITSISNPYFWLWWLTVGSSLMIGALSGGITSAIAFIMGHWGADLAWFTLVSTSIHHGRFLLSDREYRWILALCGLFLIVFGAYYAVALLR
jgi:threonine/homoserine/homoserine lactone efflux protein